MMTMMALVPQHAYRKAGDGKSAIDDLKQRCAIAHQACRYQGHKVRLRNDARHKQE